MAAFDLGKIIELFTTFGVGQGIFLLVTIAIVYFLAKHFWKMFEETIASKDEEIKRLVEENKDYRKQFLKLVDQKLNDKIELEDDEDKPLPLKKVQKVKSKK